MATPSNKTIREAAILLRSLPATQRSQLLEKLDPGQVAVVGDAMNRLASLNTEEQELVLRDFAEAKSHSMPKPIPSRSIPFQFLYELPAKTLVSVLTDQPPQAIALVLSYLPPRRSADVLAKLPAERQLEVICRIAAIVEVDPEVIGEVEAELQRRLARPGLIASGLRGLSGVVRILNVMEPPDERRLLDTLSESDPQLLHDIRRVMFGADVADCEDWPLAEAAG